MGTVISLKGIGKTFRVAKRASGLRAAAKALFKREYETVHALKQISFEIREGEIAGYIGPNGAGKSTTIKIMSGILVPDGGACEVLGFTPWKQREAYVGHIGVVFGQRTQLWWDVPVADSFELLKDIYNIPRKTYLSSRDRLIDALNLEGLLETPVRQLSLGQRMRCEIAASLLHEPRILFLDEPTIGLDAPSKLAVRQFVKRINREQGVTVILTTHDMSDIEALADRILMIGKGELLYDGSLRDLRRRFGTRRILTVEFAEHAEPVDVPGAERLHWSPQRAVFGYDSDRVTVAALVRSLAERLELLDVTVETKPIDEIILELYKEHRV